ncbi:MAG: mandelate racemase/muconate lactonizing enzyme family protein [Limnochordia bacterium]|jgi:L-alanine-DL-glutamate epimerase-like enolase superfamily enzyme
MKIADVRGRTVRGTVRPLRIGGGLTWDVSYCSTIVEIETDEGLIGRGETWFGFGEEQETVNARAIERVFKPLLVGEDPREITYLWKKLWNYAKGQGLMNPFSAIDQALWDLKGRWLGVPIYELLGGKVRDKIHAYACSPGKKAPEQIISNVKRYADLGFKATKLGIGHGVENDRQFIRTVTEAAEGRIKIAVDANGYYENLVDAMQVAEVCDECDIFWLEEPVPHTDVEGLAELNRRFKTPISGFQTEIGVFRMKHYLEKNALEIYQPRICYCGGISQSKQVSLLCDIWNKMFIPHAFGGGIKFCGTLHVVASAPSGGWVEFPISLEAEDPRQFMYASYMKNAHILNADENGLINVPQGPGNGVEIDEDVLRELEIRL